MKRLHVLLALATAAAGAAGYQFWKTFEKRLPGAEIVHQGTKSAPLTLLSAGYRLDRIYKSMEGPSSSHPGLHLPAEANDEFTWLTGIDTEVVDAESTEKISSEFLCHANLTFDQAKGKPANYNQQLGNQTHLDWRIFSIVPGRFSIHLPEGFGVPIPKGAVLDYFTMSLNQNRQGHVVNARMKTQVHAVSASDPSAPTKALFRRALYLLQPQSHRVENNSATTMKIPQHVGAGCADFCSVNASAASTVGKSGEGQTLHWLVPPGKHTYTTSLGPQLALPFDTTIHYATFHIHHYGKSMKLRDRTTGKDLLDLRSRDLPDRIGVAEVDEMKSVEGVPISSTGDYELVVEYDNTSDKDIDAMGILYLYMLEENFTPLTKKPLAQTGMSGQK